MYETKTWIFLKIYLVSLRHKMIQLLKDNPLLVISFPILLIILFYYYSLIGNGMNQIKGSIEGMNISEGSAFLSNFITSIITVLSILCFFITFFIIIFSNRDQKNDLFLTVGMVSYNDLIKIKSFIISILSCIFFFIMGFVVFFYFLAVIGFSLNGQNLTSNHEITVLIDLMYFLILLLLLFIIPTIIGFLGGSAAYLFELLVRKYFSSRWIVPFSILGIFVSSIILSSFLTLLSTTFHFDIFKYSLFAISNKLLNTMFTGSNYITLFILLIQVLVESVIIVLLAIFLFKLKLRYSHNQDDNQSILEQIRQPISSFIKNKFAYNGNKRPLAQFTADLKIFIRSNVFTGTTILGIFLTIFIISGRLLFKENTSTNSLSSTAILIGLTPFLLVITLIIQGLFVRQWDSGMDVFLFSSSYNFRYYVFVKFILSLLFTIVLSTIMIESINIFSSPKINFLNEFMPMIILLLSLGILSGFTGYFVLTPRTYLDTEGQLVISLLIFLILLILFSIIDLSKLNINLYFIAIPVIVLSIFLSFFTKKSEISN